jgi:hypothetical protein
MNTEILNNSLIGAMITPPNVGKTLPTTALVDFMTKSIEQRQAAKKEILKQIATMTPEEIKLQFDRPTFASLEIERRYAANAEARKQGKRPPYDMNGRYGKHGISMLDMDLNHIYGKMPNPVA